MVVEVTSGLIATLLEEAEAAMPRECCGLLLGEGRRIERSQPAANVSADPFTRFEIDPRALLAAHRIAREGGPQVMGYYHSHPVGEARPSATDCQNSTEDSRIWAIIACGEVAFWRESGKGFVEQPWQLLPG